LCRPSWCQLFLVLHPLISIFSLISMFKLWNILRSFTICRILNTWSSHTWKWMAQSAVAPRRFTMANFVWDLRLFVRISIYAIVFRKRTLLAWSFVTQPFGSLSKGGKFIDSKYSICQNSILHSQHHKIT
jgi:hypothetical protein